MLRVRRVPLLAALLALAAAPAAAKEWQVKMLNKGSRCGCLTL